MSLTPYHLLPADQSDISTLASIFTLAFSTDHILGPINKLVSPEALREADMQFVQKLWITREKLNARFYKVMDTESGKIIGFSKWNYPRSLTHEERYKEVGVKKKGPYPAGTNISLLEHYYDQMWAKREKWINPEKTFCKRPFLYFYPSIRPHIPSHQQSSTSSPPSLRIDGGESAPSFYLPASVPLITLMRLSTSKPRPMGWGFI